MRSVVDFPRTAWVPVRTMLPFTRPPRELEHAATAADPELLPLFLRRIVGVEAFAVAAGGRGQGCPVFQQGGPVGDSLDPAQAGRLAVRRGYIPLANPFRENFTVW